VSAVKGHLALNVPAVYAMSIGIDNLAIKAISNFLPSLRSLRLGVFVSFGAPC
jgi:hypothetical protein